MKCVLPCEYYELFTKIIVVGNSAVGKSSLLHQLTDHTFDSNPSATIGIEFVVAFFQSNKLIAEIIEGDINPVTIKAQIWDCAGQPRFDTIVNSYFRQANIVMYVYDICNIESFNNLQNWYNRAENSLHDKPYIKCVIGNKSDVIDSIIVSSEDGQKFAKSIDAFFFETSAKNSSKLNRKDCQVTIDEIFCKCVQNAYERYQHGEDTLKNSIGVPKHTVNTVKLDTSSQSSSQSSNCMKCI
jgi:small GTP-binding protein